MSDSRNPDLGVQIPNLGTQKPPKKKAQPRDMSRGVSPKTKNPDLGAQTAPGPSVGDLPAGKPVPALQDYGLFMNMDEVNQKVNSLVSAHLKAFGYKPSPGLVFDVLKSEGVTGPIDYNDLFGIPRSNREAQSMIVARSLVSPDPLATLPIVETGADILVKGMKDALKQDAKGGLGAYMSSQSNYSQFLAANKDSFEYAMSIPEDRDKLVQGMQQMKIQDAAAQLPASIQAAGMVPGNAFKIYARAVQQIVYSTADMPFGFYQMARGVGLDAYDLATQPMNDLAVMRIVTGQGNIHDLHRAFPHTTGMAERMAYQVGQDVAHPLRNPGYLIMDIWGAATMGGGALSRAGRIGSIVRDGDLTLAQKITLGSKAAVFKAPPAATDLGFGAYHESLPLSDTIIVRAIQEHTPYFGREDRQARLVANQTDGFEVRPGTKLINNIMSTESQLRRARSSRLQIQYAVDLTDVVQMQRLARWDAQMKSTLREVLSDPKEAKNWRTIAAKQQIGVQKALQVIFTDDLDPYGSWRAFHEKQLSALGEGKEGLADSDLEGRALSQAHKSIDYSIRAHQAQLEALSLAHDILMDPPARFRPLLDRAYKVAQDQETIKKTVQGLDDQVADSHLAQIGAFIHGHQVIDLGEGRKGISEADVGKVQANIKKSDQRLKNAKARLNKAQGALRFHPDRADFKSEVENAQKAVERHNAILGRHQKRLETIQNEATPLERAVKGSTLFDTSDMMANMVNAGLDEHGWDALHNAIGESGGGEAVHDVLRKFGFSGIKHEGEITRFGSPIEQAVAEMREGGPGSQHFKTEPMKYSDHLKQTGGRYVGRLRYGFRPPADVPFKAWSGKSLQIGDFRWDMTNLLAEQFASAYHVAMKKTQWHDLWNSAVDSKISDFHQPIRDIADVPDHLRELVQAMERQKMDSKSLQHATDGKLAELQKFLYPSPEDLEAGEHYKFVDERLALQKMGGRETDFYRQLDDWVGGLMGPVNEPMRLLLIFATPAYALNWLGSAALALVHQGFLAPQRYGRAVRSSAIYGDELTGMFDRLAGNTFTSSLVSERTMFTKGSQAFMEGWQKITDVHFRRAAVIHELKRHGLLDESMSNDEILATLRDPANGAKVNQAAQTARKNMLDFNSISWPERATLRHLFFVYSFVRASGIWSLRFLRDHGFMADALAQGGKNREQNIDDLIGKMPEWFMRTGYFAVHPDVVYNPIQWSMPGMLEQTGSPLSAIFGSVPYSSPAELLGPAAQFGYEAFTGNDLQGRALPEPTGWQGHIPGSHGTLGKSFLSLWQETPLGQVGVKSEKAKKQGVLKPEPVRSGFTDPISASLQRERSGLNQSVFDNDGWWNTWGQVLFRTGLPRDVNSVAGAARYWQRLRETDPKAYHQHEVKAVHAMVSRQEKVLGESAPPDVVQAVDTIAHVSQAIEDYQAQHKGEPTPNQKTVNQITIKTLAAEGRISDPQKWLKQNADAIDETQIKAVQVQVLYAAGGKAWKAWIDRVNKIDNYAQPKYDAAVQQLSDRKLGDFSDSVKAPREVRWDYGRQAEAILQKGAELAAAVPSQTGQPSAIARQAWIKYVNENDHPIKVGGKTFPSPFAIQFASKTPQEQVKALASYTKRKPEDMTAFQLQLLTGKRPDPVVTLGWGTLHTWLQEAQEALPPGHSLPAGERAFFEKTLASKSKVFADALAFSKLPLVKRMQQYPVLQTSPNKDAWNWLLNATSSAYDELKQGATYQDSSGQTKVKTSFMTGTWTKTYVPVLQQAIKDHYGDKFLSELALYSGATSFKNEDAYLTKFLVKLVSP